MLLLRRKTNNKKSIKSALVKVNKIKGKKIKT